MAKPMTSMLDYVARLPRSGFDMSQSLAFTASTGMILPVYADFLTSSERVTISTDLFARTQPLVTAAMADVDIYLDWFFVPMTMIYTPWGQIRWQTNDFVSSWFINGSTGNHGDPARPDGFPIMDVSNSVNTYNATASLSHNRAAFFSVGVNLENDSPIMYDNQFDCQGKQMFRMVDLLGFNPRAVVSSGSLLGYNPNVFPWKALAYQCIYQNWYRNDDFEQRDISTYNWDAWFNISNAQNYAGSPRNPFILRYADYRKDYYNSIKPNPLLSGVNLLGSGTNASDILHLVSNYLFEGTYKSVGSDDSNQSISQGLPVGRATSVSADSNVINTGNLRSLFAVEKLMRVTGRAAKTYDAQTLAHFGFKIPHDVKHDITHLHSSHGMLHIGEVIGTADTFTGSSGSALGEIAGKGYVSIHDDHKTKFTAPVDGALMCCFRAIPRLRVALGVDRQNAVANRTDLFIPEFDKLGMQPMIRYEFAPTSSVGSIGYLGWQLRYQQFKQKPDRASFVFSSNQIVNDSPNQYSAWVLTYTPFRNGTLGNMSANLGMYLKCPPTALNSIMVVPYQTTVSDSFATSPAAEFYTDPFICDFRAKVYKVSPMSPTGEPDMVSF